MQCNSDYSINSKRVQTSNSKRVIFNKKKKKTLNVYKLPIFFFNNWILYESKQ